MASLLTQVVTLLFLAVFASSAIAATDRPIRLVVPFSPGGATDVVARVVGQALSKKLGQPVVVDNRPGAAGSIGVQAVTNAAPDGLTLLLGSNGPIAINPSLYRSLPYSPSRDLVPVAGIASIPFLVVVNSQVPASNLKELVALAKKQPGTLHFASPGVGTTNHLVGEMLKSSTQADMTHVPYKGASPAMNAVASGEVQLMSGDVSTLMPMVESKKLKAVAVTSGQRSALAPSIPTVAESGFPGFDVYGWFGIFAPAKTPETLSIDSHRRFKRRSRSRKWCSGSTRWAGRRFRFSRRLRKDDKGRVRQMGQAAFGQQDQPGNRAIVPLARPRHLLHHPGRAQEIEIDTAISLRHRLQEELAIAARGCRR